MTHQITSENVDSYRKCLLREEYAESTVRKYVGDIRAFCVWLERFGAEESGQGASGSGFFGIDRETAARWKSYLVEEGYASVTVNAMLSSLNSFFRFFIFLFLHCHIIFLCARKSANYCDKQHPEQYRYTALA